MAVRIGIDTGGTFTDVVALDEDTGAVRSAKVPSTPGDPSRAFMQALALMGTPIASVAHGTTVATNAVLEERFHGLGLIVTRGFQDLLEIGRQTVPQGYGNAYFWVKPERIVPVHHVREVAERLDSHGQVLTELDEADAEAAAAWCRDRGLDSIGVCFLHAYANPAHEQRMREVLLQVHPRAHVSLSSEVLPEYREYERAMTTLLDAFVKPRVSRYVDRIEQRLRSELGAETPFSLMQSNGGVVSAAAVARKPVATILSGPAAGALGAALLADAAGLDRVLSLDGGGTSTDVALVEHGAPQLTTSGSVGRFPVKVPMIDIVTVGAGGGSIAWLAADGRLRVGPRSAGAQPGPMCYGHGGSEPTITDAALFLGRIPASLLGGQMPLDRGLAERGLADLARRLSMATERAAAGVLEIAAWSQANAVRQVTVRRGLDVRDYVLVAFGGSGPLQAGKLIEVLRLRGALIPRSPGTVSAFGLLTVDLKNDFVATAVQRHDRLDPTDLERRYAALEAQAHDSLAHPDVHLVRSADLRYYGQAWEVRVDVPDGPFERRTARLVVDRFHAAHQMAYGYSYRDAPDQVVEWVNLRITAIGRLPRPRIAKLDRALGGDSRRAQTGTRRVVFDSGCPETPIYQRDLLQPLDAFRGPAIVEESGSTTVVDPGLSSTVDQYGNLFLTRG